MAFGIRLLKRWPDEGVRAIATLVFMELRDRQEFTQDEMLGFFDELLNCFFPCEMKEFAEKAVAARSL